MMVESEPGVFDDLPDITALTADAGATIATLLGSFAVETTSGEAERIGRYPDFLRPGTPVYITHPAGTDFGLVVEVARKLRREGLDPVPHLAARSIFGRDELETNIARATGAAGVEDILVIASGLSRLVGDYSSAME
jgi:methylenetetrahydrofolate reductase (NADPH)